MKTFAHGVAQAITLAAGVGLALAAGLGLLGDWRWRLDAVNHFAPWIALAAVGVMLLSARLKLGAAGLAPAALALAASTALIAPELQPPPRPPSIALAERPIKLVWFNVWARNRDIAQAEAFLRAENPDLILLTEAVDNSGGLVAALAPHWRLASGHPDAAVRVLSRWPQAPDGPTGASALVARARLIVPEAAGGGSLDVMAAHTGRPWPPSMQRDHYGKVAADAAELDPARSIIAGDLNAAPWSFVFRSLSARLSQRRVTRGLLTWPTSARWPLVPPLVPIDHVFAGRDLAVEQVRRGPPAGSDHHPVVVVFRLPAASR